MSMTPEQILQLPSFGKIPAETQIGDLRTAFGGETTHGLLYSRNWTGSVTFSSSSSAYTSTIDISSSLADYVSATKMCRIQLILIGNFGGGFNYACKYTNGSDTTVTTKTVANGDKSTNYEGKLGGGVFAWNVTLDNFANNAKFQVGLTASGTTSAGINLRFVIFGFPIEYGHEI